MNRFMRTWASRMCVCKAMRLAVPMIALCFALAVPMGLARADDHRQTGLDDGDILQVEDGNKLAFHVFGVGVQIYKWNGVSWVFQAPEAMLFADAGDHGLVGIHFGGPTWQSLSGSQVVATVEQRRTPDPSAIAWLLLKAVPELTGGPGIFGDVTFVQRLNTVGGIAPNVPGDFVGQVARVPYSSDYSFYRSAH